jgi:hypothetical protein
MSQCSEPGNRRRRISGAALADENAGVLAESAKE